jgi:hypothetical protein
LGKYFKNLFVYPWVTSPYEWKILKQDVKQ